MFLRLSLIWLLLLLIPLSGGAMSVLSLNLSDMTSQSGMIFAGRCLSIEADQDENGLPVTWVRFQVEEGLKGADSGKTVLVKQFGIPRTALHVAEGERAVLPLKGIRSAPANYEVGREYFLFFYPESTLGMTSPVGGGQGYFEIQFQGAGQGLEGAALKTVVNPFNNQFLQTVRSGPVPMDEMIREVKQLIESH